MKRIIATVFLLASTTAALAQAPEPVWRSPFTAAPSLSMTSPLSAEKNQKAREQDLAAWKAGHPASASASKKEDRPVFLTSPAQLGRQR
jgi:hypothetical protein